MAEIGDRTERATPRRREEARKHGQTTLSPEIGPVAVMVGALLLVSSGAPAALAQGRRLLAEWLAAVGTVGAEREASLYAAGPLFERTAVELGWLLGPFFLTTAAVGTAAVVAQVDRRRVKALAGFFEEGGFAAAEARVRARVFYTFLLGEPQVRAPGRELEKMVKILSA